MFDQIDGVQVKGSFCQLQACELGICLGLNRFRSKDKRDKHVQTRPRSPDT